MPDKKKVMEVAGGTIEHDSESETFYPEGGPSTLFVAMRPGAVECAHFDRAILQHKLDDLADTFGGEWVSDLAVVEFVPKGWARHMLRRVLARIDTALAETPLYSKPAIQKEAARQTVRREGEKETDE